MDGKDHPELIYELIITIINVMSIIANLLLIVTILRTKTMRTKTNLYILNISMADLCTLVVLLIYYAEKRLLHFVDVERERRFQCILTNLEISLQILTCLFVIILLSNSLYNLKLLLILALWNANLILFYVNFQYCNERMTFVQGTIYCALLCVLVLILLGKYCCRNLNDRDGAFRLNFATIFTSLCLFSWLVNIVAEFGFNRTDSGQLVVRHYVLALGTSVKIGKNVALACYLFRHNEMFKDSLMALFNCKSVRISVVNYGGQAPAEKL